MVLCSNMSLYTVPCSIFCHFLCCAVMLSMDFHLIYCNYQFELDRKILCAPHHYGAIQCLMRNKCLTDRQTEIDQLNVSRRVQIMIKCDCISKVEWNSAQSLSYYANSQMLLWTSTRINFLLDGKVVEQKQLKMGKKFATQPNQMNVKKV